MSNRGTAIITGASQGIGKAIALRLAQEGYDLALNDLPTQLEKLKELEKEITGTGRRVVLVPGDISEEEQVKSMVQTTVEKLGGLDVMVANGGACMGKSIMDTTVEEWDRIMKVNGRGTFLCYKYGAEQMIKQGRGGRIIGASSNSGKQGTGLMAAYSSSKFSVRGLTQAAAQEWAKHKITVNAYAPGAIPTTMSMQAGQDLMAADPSLKEFVTKIPYGEPQHIAAFVAYCVDPDSSFMTGQTIAINGGTYFD